MYSNGRIRYRTWIIYLLIWFLVDSVICATTPVDDDSKWYRINTENDIETTTVRNEQSTGTTTDHVEKVQDMTTTIGDYETTTFGLIDETTEVTTNDHSEETTISGGEADEVTETSTEQITTTELIEEVTYSDYADAARIHLLHELINSSVHPCENFYEYVCGDYGYLYPLRENEHEQSILSLHEYQEHQKIIAMLQEDVNDDAEDEAWRKTKDFFTSCLEEDTLNKRGIQPLLNMVRGKWPVITPEMEEKEHSDWLDLVSEYRELNFNCLIELDLGRDFKHPERLRLHLKAPTNEHFTLEEYHEKPTEFIKYRKYVELMHILFGVNPKIASDIALDIIEFEKQLLEIRQEMDNEGDVVMKAEDFIKQVSGIDWKKYARKTLGRELRKNEELMIQSLNYFQKLSNLVSSTDSTLLNNYIIWKFVEVHVDYLDDRFDDLRRLYLNRKPQDRINACLNIVRELDPLRKKYVESIYNEDVKKDLTKLTELLRLSFRDLIETSDLVGESTRRIALEKLDAIYFEVAYEELLTFDLNKEFENVTIAKDKFFENMLEISEHKAKKVLRFPYALNTDGSTYPGLNVFYYILGNRITVPASLLKDPFYNTKVRRNFNFGGVGSLIAKEMANAFIGLGRSYGAYGTPRNWWDNDSLKRYSERFMCFEKQMNETLAEEEIQINDGLVEDNIAGFIGLAQSYQAYQKWLEKHPEQIHPTISWEKDIHKLFFIQFTYMRCNNLQNRDSIFYSEELDTPNLSEFFVNGILSNSEVFNLVYGCQAYDEMNSVEKCKLW